MSDKHLERKEVLNLVYTQQADRMADAYARLMADFSQTTAWGRGLESDLSWARSELMQVKAEVELWKLRSDNWQKFCQLTRPEMTDELNRLKAEVERLTLENSQYEEHHKYGQNVITSLREDVEQLTVARNYFIHKMMQTIKEVDRLTKAGDCLVIHIEACYRAEGYDPKDCDMIDNWNAAKEGKPRA